MAQDAAGPRMCLAANVLQIWFANLVMNLVFERKFYKNVHYVNQSTEITSLYLPRPQALIKKFHASHYMKGLHEVVHRDEQAQGVMGLNQNAHIPLPFAHL